METSTLIESAIVSASFSDYKSYNEGPTAEDEGTDSLVLSTVILLSLIGNILVVVISVFCMRLRSLTSIFILNLALSDLLFTVGLVLRVCKYFWGLTLGDAACKAVYWIFPAGFYSSIVFLVLMSVQHYITVVHPHTGWKKGHCFTLVLISAWMMSILAALPVGLHVVAHPDSGGCTYSSESAFVAVIYKENIIFVCAFLFMPFCYIRILQTIFKSPTNQKHRTAGLVFFLVATFFICWAPYNIIIFLDTFPHDQIKLLTQDLEHFYYITYICYILACTRCCLNPVIYGLFGLIFRKTAREIFQRRANFNSAQIRIGHSDSCVNLHN